MDILWAPETLTHGSTWINLHDCRLRDIRNMIWLHSCELPRVFKYIETRSRAAIVGQWLRKVGSWCSVGTEVRYEKMLSGTDGVDGTQ